MLIFSRRPLRLGFRVTWKPISIALSGIVLVTVAAYLQAQNTILRAQQTAYDDYLYGMSDAGGVYTSTDTEVNPRATFSISGAPHISTAGRSLRVVSVPVIVRGPSPGACYALNAVVNQLFVPSTNCHPVSDGTGWWQFHFDEGKVSLSSSGVLQFQFSRLQTNEFHEDLAVSVHTETVGGFQAYSLIGWPFRLLSGYGG